MNSRIERMLRRYMDQASDAASGGGGGGGGGDAAAKAAADAASAAAAGGDAGKAAADAAAAKAATDKAAADAAASNDPSLLAQGKAAADAAAAAAKPGAASTDWIPEKYRVMEGEEGKKALNVEASMKKVAEAHGALEKRAGELGLPPEKATDYKINLPADSKIKVEDFEGPVLDGFRDAAHKSGQTQKQFDASIAAHLQGINDLVTQLGERGATMAKAELEADPDWQGANMTPQLKLAYRTFNAFATKEEAAEIDRIGNNPVFLKVMARIGKDLGEDRLGRGSGNAAVVEESTLQEYMKAGGPYWDAAHPDHKKYVDIVTRHHQAKFGTKAIAASGHG